MMPGVLAANVLGFRLYELLMAVAVFTITLIATRIVLSTIQKKVNEISKKTKTSIDDVIAGMIAILGWPFYLLIAFYAVVHTVTVPDYVRAWYGYLFVIVLSYYGARVVIRAIEVSVDVTIRNKRKRGEKVDRTILDFFARLAKGAVIAVAVLFMLSGLGYDVTGIAMGLGVVGIAVAFAVQNILEDLFSALSIYLDRPFEIGDFISFDDVQGTVKKIGIMSTRLTSITGEEIVVSNNDLLSTRVHNYGRLKERRVSFRVGIEYGTPLKKVEKAKKVIQEIIKKQSGVRLDRVHLVELGDYSLNFEVVYYVLSPSYVDYLDAQERINKEILRRFEKEKIGIAYPAQTVFVRRE